MSSVASPRERGKDVVGVVAVAVVDEIGRWGGGERDAWSVAAVFCLGGVDEIVRSAS